MIAGPIAVLIIGKQGSGKSTILDILTTAIAARSEAAITMGSREPQPRIRFCDDGADPVGPDDAEIHIHLMQVDDAKAITALLDLRERGKR